MPITPTSSAASTPTSPSLSGVADGTGLGRDEFLQLLVAQLRNQDPTSPQDGHEFAAQLAQFSQVEQLTNINGSLGAQAAQIAALAEAVSGLQTGQADMTAALSGRINLQAATALVGQTVEVAGSAIDWDGSAPVDVPLRLDGAAREVEVVIRNADGDVVRTIRTGAHDAGLHSVSWDGALDDGSDAPAGAYSATVSAIGPDGQAVGASAVMSGTVERLTVDGGGVSLWIDGRAYSFDALVSVVQTADASAPAARRDFRSLHPSLNMP